MEGQSLNVDSDVALFESIFKRALLGLVDNGSRQDEQLARTKLLALEKGEQGVGRTIIEVWWCDSVKCIDFSSQSLGIGDLYYSDFHLGDSITVSTQLQKSLGWPVKTESNQCVLFHIAAAYEWEEQNCPTRVPSRTRVDSLAEQVRQVEYRQGAQGVSRIKRPHARGEHEIWPHDVITPNHDRQFREIPLYLQRGLGRIKELTLRIIDIESSGPRPTVGMHIFGPNTEKKPQQI